MTTLRRSWGATAVAARRLAPRIAPPQRRRKAVWLTLTLLAAAGLCATLLPLKVFGSGSETGVVFAHLSWGKGDSQVGLMNVKEGLTRGPEALAVAPDGRVAVLDSVNSRLVLLDPAGQPLGTVKLALAQPRFLAVDDQTLYVLDCDAERTLLAYSWSGDLLSESPLPETTELVSDLFATSEGPCVEIAHRDSLVVGQESVRVLPGRPVGGRTDMIASASCLPDEGMRIRARSIAASGADRVSVAEEVELTPPMTSGGAVEHLVSVDTDGRGGLLVGMRLLRPQTKGRITSALAITQLPSVSQDNGAGDAMSIQAGNGAMLLLQECAFAYLGAPYVVAPDGRIFQPMADKSGYTILVHTFEEVE